MSRRMRITPATVIATVALVAAVGGTAYAATKIDTEDIANNAITARQVENDSLKGKDFKEGGLKGSDIGDGKIGLDKLSDDAVAALKPRWLLLDEQGQIEEQSRWVHRPRRLRDEQQRLHRRRVGRSRAMD